MRVAIYIRVSTEEQAKEGFSIRAQRMQLIEYCKVHDYTVSDVYIDDGYSAKDTNRPHLQRLLDDAKAGKLDAVVVYKLDRFTRSVKDLYELLEFLQSCKVDFISKQEKFDTTTAMGRAMIGILGVFAQFERELISERVRMGQEQRTREGKKHGAFPFGYDKEGNLVPDEVEQLRTIRDLYMTENMGLKSIAMHMNNKGLQRRGFDWRPSIIAISLENPFYAGIIEYGGKRPDGKYPRRRRELMVDVIRSQSPYEPVWTEQEFNEHIKLMRRRSNDGYSRKLEYWFTGLLRCGRCGASMHGRMLVGPVRKDGDRTRSPYYMCNRRMDNNKCDMPQFRQSHIELILMEYIQKLRMDPVLSLAEQKRLKIEKKNTEQLKAKLKRELENVKERIKKWQYMFVEELITADDLRSRLDEEHKKEVDFKDQLEKLLEGDKETPERQAQLFNIADIWPLINDDEKKVILNATFNEIKVHTNAVKPKGKKNEYFDAWVDIDYL